MAPNPIIPRYHFGNFVHQRVNNWRMSRNVIVYYKNDETSNDMHVIVCILREPKRHNVSEKF